MYKLSAFALGLLSLLFQSVAGAAQEPANTGVAVGLVTGHVVCSDTQRPARLAQIRLVAFPDSSKSAAPAAAIAVKMSGLQADELFGSDLSPVETDMDGSFTARNVKPGRYIVRVDLSGYLTPLLRFSPEAFRAPDVATRQRISRDLQVVTVRPHAETRVDVSLERGATITGTVRFDDGSPAIGISTQLLTKNAEGKWEDARASAAHFGNTDAQGRYEIDGIPPGTYMVKVFLALNEFTNSVLPVNGNEVHVTMSKTVFSLPVYLGDALRDRDATPIKVEGQGIHDGNDITLPISKLHHVTGSVLGGGHPVNGGKVVLQYADDGSELDSVEISHEDQQFHFYVPEGSYILKVEEARDVVEIEVPNAPGIQPKTHTETKTVHTYGKVEQSLIVQSDVEGVLATVPEAKAQTAAAGTSPEK